MGQAYRQPGSLPRRGTSRRAAGRRVRCCASCRPCSPAGHYGALRRGCVSQPRAEGRPIDSASHGPPRPATGRRHGQTRSRSSSSVTRGNRSWAGVQRKPGTRAPPANERQHQWRRYVRSSHRRAPRSQ
ncbi:hypothetical protein DSL92_03340 [Billgrantia gudaonensis]|uniref:Uncharacterized protein n=1 Tax=Billgrantia gudaonensis TaxID=376427 RepID=A0A432JJZ8_9GAMM|nr:hypothetical protein DSL92_03340 [Halomonas gudaonensis]